MPSKRMIMLFDVLKTLLFTPSVLIELRNDPKNLVFANFITYWPFFDSLVALVTALIHRGVFMWIRIAICDAIWANCESKVKLIRNFANQK